MGSCAAPSAKGDDKFITTDYLQQCPLGYLARHSLRRISDTTRLLFAKPRYVKPAGTLRRATKVKADKK
ncbi:cellulose biosynthesis protein BcsF [Salmonella sp. SKLX111445]